MSKRNKLLALSLSLMAVVFAGCSGGASPDASAVPGASADNKGGASPEAKDGGKTEQTELRILWWGSQDRHDMTLKVLDLFQKKYPNIKVTPEFTGWDGYWDKLSVQISGGNAPDVIQMSYAYLSDYVNRQAMLDLTGQGIGFDGIEDSTLSTGKLNGKLYAVPAGISSYAMLYDPAMLEKANIKLPEQPTWDDYEKMGQQIKDKLGREGIVLMDESGNIDILNLYVRQKGMAFFSGNKLGFTEQALTEYFNYWTKLRKAGTVASGALTASFAGGTIEKSPIVTGKTPFTMFSMNQYVSYFGMANRPLELALTPRQPDGKEANYLIPSMYWSVYSKSKHTKEAAMLIDFLTNDVEAGKIQGVNRGVPISSKIRDAIKPQLSETDKKQIAYIDKITKIAVPADVIEPKGAAEVRNLLVSVTQEMQFDKKTPEQAAQDFIKKANDILEKAK
ncbi:ABC transporter substrate-binding protein [Paenibacillus contaminans]|uniref:Sugar ABC transporter substrate-binding protein n=1 Tax=Paenibacillus contaminans TaxID=450362 RepID=A0A329M1C6_9BACL|nr:extracellular solute-binding protein [Paenibacillus contaminans]RAV12493.1 hypothetical protein DQG23_34765 [Paenibacillus contaminans]